MACEQMMQFQTAASRPSVISSRDPYVFAEPPSIQTLQLHKAATSKGYSKVLSSAATPPASPSKPPPHRHHNVNESLKRKLGIAHVKVPAHTPLSSTSYSSSATSPMISGARQSTGPGNSAITTTKRGAAPTRRQSEPTAVPADTVSQPPPTDAINNQNNQKKPTRESRGPRGKYAKRDPKKTTAAQVATAASTNNLVRDYELLQVPHDFWFKCVGGDADASEALYLRHWYLPEMSDPVPSCPDTPLPTSSASTSPTVLVPLTRDERIELKRSEMRRRTVQLRNGQRHREVLSSRRRFLLVHSTLLQEEVGGTVPLGMGRGKLSPGVGVCRADGCQNEALIFTAFCPAHITEAADQLLFAPCSVQMPDKTQCKRVPLFDASHEQPLCEEHARTGMEVAKQQLATIRPRKSTVRGGGEVNKAVVAAAVPVTVPARASTVKRAAPTVVVVQSSAMPVKAPFLAKQQQQLQQAKRTHPVAVNLPVNKQHLVHGSVVQVPVKTTTTVTAPRTAVAKPRPEMLTRFTKDHPGAVLFRQQKAPVRPVVMMMQDEHDDFVDEDDSVGLCGEGDGGEEEEVDSLLNHGSRKSTSSYEVVKRKGSSGGGGRAVLAANQTDLLLVSENSSAYESSEDTGVGGLSESEMIEEIGFDSQFLEDPEFDNVLEDLLAVEQHGEMFESMTVDDDVKTMEMTGTSTFLGDFLADQMLHDSGAAGAGSNANAHSRMGANQLIQA